MQWTQAGKPTRVGLVQLSPPPQPWPFDRYLELTVAKVAEAAARRCDVVCIPETATMLASGLKDWKDAAAPLPGPVSAALADVAKAARMYVVGWQVERDGNRIFNTSFLLDRGGQLIGRHRKTHLTKAELNAGITTGEKLEIFQTDFGRVGVMICWESYFPEVPRCLALRGAQIIFHPLQGDDSAEQWLVRERSYALTNGVIIASARCAGCAGGATAVIDKMGNVIARDHGGMELVQADVDVQAEAITHTYACGPMWERHHALLCAQRRPDLYRDLVTPWNGDRVEDALVPPPESPESPPANTK
jgi:predicted amidohydrolase